MVSRRISNSSIIHAVMALGWFLSQTDGGLNHYRRLMQQSRKSMAHSSIVNTLNHAKWRAVRETAEKSWDEKLYGHDRSVIEDEDQITRMLMAKESLADSDKSSQQLYIAGQLVSGTARPPLPAMQRLLTWC